MDKVYVLSKRKDAELEQAIHDMDAYHLRIALYGVARGWQFDEAFSIAKEAAQQSVQRTCAGAGKHNWVTAEQTYQYCVNCGTRR